MRKEQDSPSRPETWLALPKVSILVAAWNARETLPALLHSYSVLDYPNRELVLCAGGADGTYEMAAQWVGPQIKLLVQHAGEGKFRALQRCLGHSDGALIMLTDADCVLNRDSFQRLLYPLMAGKAVATAGTLQPLSRQLCIPFVVCQWFELQHSLLSLMVKSNLSPFLVGGNSMLMRPVVEAAYNTTLPNPIGEDTYLALSIQKAGHRILRVPDSYVQTYFPETFMQYVRQRSRWRRDQLLQHYQAGDKMVLSKGLLSIAKHLCWLLLPILPVFFESVGLLVWLSVWGWALMAQFHRYRMGKRTIRKDRVAMQAHYPDIPLLNLFGLVLAQSCAVIHLAIHLAIPEWRYRW